MTWHTRANVVLRDLIDTGEPFTADDLLERVGHPDETHGANAANNAVGAVFGEASRAGLIVPCGVRQSRQPKRKGGMVRVWKASENRPPTLFQ